MADYPAPQAVYLHIPFCTPCKCRYCDFFSEPLTGDSEFRFLLSLQKEIALTSMCVSPYTLFLGGGTPTALSPLILAEVLHSLTKFDLSNVVEYSSEANPGSLTSEKLAIMRDAGINRLSIGAQSFSSQALAFLGRKHSPLDMNHSIDSARKANITNISIDLISDIPNTTLSDWKHDLEQAVKSGVSHISAYSLSYERSTPLWNALQLREFLPLNDEESVERMNFTREFLTSHGYRHYEISNYCKPNMECKHNLLYWRNGSYLGLGPSAVSFIRGVRSVNIRNLDGYNGALNAGVRPLLSSETLSPSAFAGETAMLMLRRRCGINQAEFLTATGFDVFSFYADTIARLIESGLLEILGTNVRIPNDKIALSDLVAAEFLEVSE